MDMARKYWNDTTASHLLRRTGFAAPPRIVQQAVQQEPAQVVDHLLDFKPLPPDRFPLPAWLNEPDADARSFRKALAGLTPEKQQEKRRMLQREQNQRLVELRGWWLDRMMRTPNPLQEKLTLFWHGHFATSAVKVRSAYAMFLQNEMFRAQAAGNWRTMLQSLARDPAMLIYLDNAQSRKQHPNENFARELMELFTLGEGQYTEEDIQASARAFTGYSLDSEQMAYRYRPFFHDDGHKTFFGETGPWDGDAIIEMILKQDASAPFICRKLAAYFIGSDPDETLVEDMARILRDQDWEWKPVLRHLFLSRAFYLEKDIASAIKSPVEWLVGSCLLLERSLPPSWACQRVLTELGQTLFAPPNVKGWDGGYTWINTTTLTRRNEYAETLVEGQPERIRRPMLRQGKEIARFPSIQCDDVLPDAYRSNKQDALNHLAQRFLPLPLREQDTLFLEQLTHAWTEEPASWEETHIRQAAITLMQRPAYQLT
jgi:uncharacterized protein (DUF1800 family)